MLAPLQERNVRALAPCTQHLRRTSGGSTPRAACLPQGLPLLRYQVPTALAAGFWNSLKPQFVSSAKGSAREGQGGVGWVHRW